MRLPLLFLLICTVAGSAIASEHYPYLAKIAVVETPVLSGPSSQYYMTSQLKKGEQVEVYYETEDWCAIRPPVGSFSWISARYVNLGTNGIGEIITDGLASRIGSEEAELCDTVQVKLKRGEKVLVIGRRETPENDASPLWYKIAPPSGEFRWIPRSALFAEVSLAKTDRSITQVVYETESDVGLVLPVIPQTPMAPRRTPPVEQEAVVTDPPVSKESARSQTQGPALDLAPLSNLLASNRPEQIMIVKETPKPVDPVRQAFDKAFEELKSETRVAMTRPTEDWVFQTLIDRGNELYDVAPSDSDLEKVYHLVETLQRTWDVRKEIAYRRQFRTGGLLTPPPSATPSPAPTAATYTTTYGSNYTKTAATPAPLGAPAAQPLAATTSNTITHTVSETSPRIPTDKSTQCGFKLHGYDVVGKLGEFESPPTGYPPYAVVDENERILCLITPAVGVAMKEHVGKIVGVNGILGFYEKNHQPKRRHITVQEIDVLSFK